MSPEQLPFALRSHWLAALARRTAALPPGPARTQLEGRLAALLATEPAPARGAPLGQAASPSAPQRAAAHPLALLNAQIRQRLRAAQTDETPAAPPLTPPSKASPATQRPGNGIGSGNSHAVGGRSVTPRTAAAPAVTAPLPGPASAPGLKAARVFQQHYARQRVDQRLHRALAAQPAQAGPLNSHSLVVQALQQLNAASPDYLQRLIAQVDALVALEALARAVAIPADKAADKPTGRPAADRRPG